MKMIHLKKTARIFNFPPHKTYIKAVLSLLNNYNYACENNPGKYFLKYSIKMASAKRFLGTSEQDEY